MDTKEFTSGRMVAKRICSFTDWWLFLFLPNPNNYEEVNHLDENKANNKLENLEWCTHSYNMNYGEVKKKISESHKGKVISEKSRKKLSENSKNRKWINNGKLEKCVKENKLNNFLINGWNFGRIKNMEV